MSTIIWTILGWIGASLLFAWGWSRWRRHEEALLDDEQFSIDDDEPIERDFVMERAKLEADCEEAEEHRAELARADFEARMERMLEMKEGKP
jgi:hypothetical protein